MTWTGWTGETFNLAGDFKAATLMEAEGRSGLVMPPIEHYSVRAATSDGETWQGYNVLPRDVTWPIIIVGDSPQAMREEHRRFLATMRPDQTGTLDVYAPDGEKRSLTLRYMAGAEGDFGTTTYGGYWLRHSIKMRAYDPFFYGDPITQPFAYAPGVNFYGGGTGTTAPLFYISSSRTVDSAQITNPGDADVYGVWRIYGPFTSATVGFGSSTIVLPFTISAPHWVEVNTDRRVATIVDDLGANRWADAGTVKFAPLPAGATTTLAVTIAGAGTGTAVEFSFRPKFWRAW
jgi:hypothetical protein